MAKFTPWHRSGKMVALTFGVWTTIGIVSATNYRMMSPASTWMAVLQTHLLAVWLWVPFTLLVFTISKRFPLGPREYATSNRTVVWHWLVHFAINAAIILARAGLIAAFNPIGHWYATLPRWPELLMTSVDNNLSLYWLQVGVAHAFAFSQRVRERDQQAQALKQEIAQAKLETLRAQLNPHFLFNALNSLAELVYVDVERAEAGIMQLSRLLRRVLEITTRTTISLEQELATTRDYVELERLRFGERLQVTWEIETDLLQTKVVPLAIQTLVENAVRHGRAEAGTPLEIIVCITRLADSIEVRVENSDAGAALGQRRQLHDTTNGEPRAHQIGLRNLRSRLTQQFSSDFVLEHEHSANATYAARLLLPQSTHANATSI